MFLPGFGINPILLILQLSIFTLPVVSWIVLYVKGAEARDLLFWGVYCRGHSYPGSLGSHYLCFEKQSRQAEAPVRGANDIAACAVATFA